MFGPYVHNVDPIIAEVGGVYLWWYGLSYSLGFLHLHLFLRRHRLRLGLTSRDVYTLTLFIVVGVLVGGASHRSRIRRVALLQRAPYPHSGILAWGPGVSRGPSRSHRL